MVLSQRYGVCIRLSLNSQDKYQNPRLNLSILKTNRKFSLVRNASQAVNVFKVFAPPPVASENNDDMQELALCSLFFFVAWQSVHRGEKQLM